MGRFDDLLTNTPASAGSGFSDLLNASGNRFDDLISTPPQEQGGIFQRTLKSFGGAIGALSNVLLAPQRATAGLIEKGLETVGVLKPKTEGLGIVQGVQEQKSNIETLKRVGQETGLGGVLTGQYTPSTSVFGNFIKEIPATTLGTLADIFIDPLFFASKVGAVAKGTEAVGQAIATATKTVAEEIPAVQKVGDMLGKAFITRFGQRPEFQALDVGRKVEESLIGENINKLVSPIIEKPAIIQQRITQLIKGEAPQKIDISQYRVPSQRTAQEFEKSTSQVLIPAQISSEVGNFELGSFGRNAIERKVVQPDRFPINEIGKTLDNSFLAIPASRNPQNWRFDNIVFLSKDAEGLRAIYTRPNTRGALEIINAHKIPKDNVAKYFEDIGFNGIPDRIRTGITNLEDSQFIRLAYGDTLNLAEQMAKVKQERGGIKRGLSLTDNELKILAEPIRQELDRVGESISKLNPKLLSEETFQANKGTYFPRLYTDYEFPEPEKAVEQMFGSRAVSIPKEPFKARTLTEEQSLAKGTRIEEAGFPALKRLTQLNVTEQRQKFFSEVAKLASDQPKPGWIQLSEDKALGNLAGKFLPAAEHGAIAQIRHIPSQTEQIYNKALMLWKTFKTAYNPATIARNDITNYFILNPLGGVGPHRLDIYARTANEIMTKGQMYQLARKEGLELSTQQAAELTQQATRFYRENQSLVKQFFNKMGDFHEAVKNFYGSQDKFFKLANFIKGVQEDGLTPYQAMRRANFYLVDYSEVPQAVEWLRKSPVGIPFISFTYGVSKPLAKTLLERPDKLAAYFKILSGIQQMNPQGETLQDRQKELDVAPDWIQEGTFLRLPFRDKFGRGQYVDLQYILPFNIIESHSMLPSNPVLNTVASILTNKDVFTGRDIVKETDTTSEKVQKYTASFFAQLLPSLTPFVGTSYTKAVNALEQRPDRNGFVKSKLEAAVDIFGGIKITPIDPTIEAQKRAFEKQRELQALHSELKSIMLNKALFPEERQRESAKVLKKIQDASGQPIVQP